MATAAPNMKTLLRDPRVQRLLMANITGSIGSGVTIIAVPWLLVHRANGDQLYGWTTLGTTIALFLFMPYYGAWIDRHSRKSMLLIGETFGFVATLSMGCWALASGDIATWQLVASYFCGMLYYTLHYPAKFAFLQQVFTRDQYQSLIGLLEIQGQTAMMVAGGLASLLIDHVPFGAILLLDAGTYLFSFLVQSTLPYHASHLAELAGKPAQSTWRAMVEGWEWLRDRPRLTVFFACTYVPFVMVMVSNYLFPIYVSKVLHASSATFGQGEIVFAVGAALAGALIPTLANQHGGQHTILFTTSACIASMLLIVCFPTAAVYFVALLLFGFGNAGTRVARTALLMCVVPTGVMGRLGMFFGVYDRVLRTVLTFVMTLIVARGSPTLGFAVLLVVLLIAFSGAFLSRRSVVVPADPQVAA